MKVSTVGYKEKYSLNGLPQEWFLKSPKSFFIKEGRWLLQDLGSCLRYGITCIRASIPPEKPKGLTADGLTIGGISVQMRFSCTSGVGQSKRWAGIPYGPDMTTPNGSSVAVLCPGNWTCQTGMAPGERGPREGVPDFQRLQEKQATNN